MLLLQAVVNRLETDEQIKTAEQIFENYRNAMYQAAFHILENTHDAEEAVSDTIVKICRHIEDFTAISVQEQKLLVRKYTERTAIDKWRERKCKSTVDISDYLFEIENSECDVMNDEASITFSGDEFGVLQKYILKIPQKYKDVLVLRYVMDFENKKIAGVMNMPESTVSTQISRAKQLLRKILEEERGELYGKVKE